MEKSNKKIGFVAFGIFFAVAFVSNLSEGIVPAILNGILGGLLFGGLSLVIFNKIVKEGIVVDKWWKWTFYIIGFISLLTPVFWIIFLPWHFIKDSGNRFFSKKAIENIVYPFGQVFSLLALIGFVAQLI